MSTQFSKSIELFRIINPNDRKFEKYIINGTKDFHKVETDEIDYYQLADNIAPDANQGDIYLVDDNNSFRRVYNAKSSHNSLFITNRCNQNCIICSQPPSNYYDLDYFFDINKKVIDLISESPKSIGITGGEPTLLGKRLYELLKLINTKHQDTSIHMLTNGLYYANLDNVSELSEIQINNLFLGVPLYSHVYNKHNYIVQSNSYFKVLDALYNLATFNFNIELRIVISRLNFEDLLGLSKFIQKNLPFISHIAFMGLETIGNAIDNIKQCWIDPIEIMSKLKDSIDFLDDNYFNISVYNIPLCLLDSSIRKFSRDSISDWKKKNYPDCDFCLQKENCSGVFDSTLPFYINHINPFN